MTSSLSILFHLISPLQRGDRWRKERKGEIEGCVINCRIIHSRHNLLQAEYHTAIVKVGKYSVPAHAACCYLCVKFTELFKIFIASHILRQNKYYIKLGGYLEISIRTSFTRNRVHETELTLSCAWAISLDLLGPILEVTSSSYEADEGITFSSLVIPEWRLCEGALLLPRYQSLKASCIFHADVQLISQDVYLTRWGTSLSRYRELNIECLSRKARYTSNSGLPISQDWMYFFQTGVRTSQDLQITHQYNSLSRDVFLTEHGTDLSRQCALNTGYLSLKTWCP